MLCPLASPLQITLSKGLWSASEQFTASLPLILLESNHATWRMIFEINRLEPGRDGIKQSAFSSSQGEEKKQTVCPLYQLISPSSWTLGKRSTQ